MSEKGQGAFNLGKHYDENDYAVNALAGRTSNVFENTRGTEFHKRAEGIQYDEHVAWCAQEGIQPLQRFPDHNTIYNDNSNDDTNMRHNVEKKIYSAMKRNLQLSHKKNDNHNNFNEVPLNNFNEVPLIDDILDIDGRQTWDVKENISTYKQNNEIEKRNRILTKNDKEEDDFSEFSPFELLSMYSFDKKYMIWEIEHIYTTSINTQSKLLETNPPCVITDVARSFIDNIIGKPIEEVKTAVANMADMINSFIGYFKGDHIDKIVTSFMKDLDKIKADALGKLNKPVDFEGIVLCAIVTLAEFEFDDLLLIEKLNECNLIYDSPERKKQFDVSLMKYARVYFKESIEQDVMLMRYLFKERVRNGVINCLLFFIQELIGLREPITYDDFLQIPENKWIVFEHSLLIIIKKITTPAHLSDNAKHRVIPMSFRKSILSDKWKLFRKYPPCIGKIENCLIHLYSRECSIDNAFKNKLTRLVTKTDNDDGLFRSKLFREYLPHEIVGQQSFMADFGYTDFSETLALFLPRSKIGDFEKHEILRITGLIMICNIHATPDGRIKKMVDFDNFNFSTSILNTLESKYESPFVTDQFKSKNNRSEKLKNLIKRMICKNK